MARFGLALFVALVGMTHLVQTARADGPSGLQTSQEPSAIYGGADVASCGWPTTVSMEGGCTATLVHPQVVIYAAHCGTGYQNIWLGESINSPKRTLKPEFCKTFQGGQDGTDFAFCKLSEPVLDVPIVPVLMGCETELLQPGQEVTIVGFGQADTGPYGIKREVVTTINKIQNNEAFIGGGGKDSCQGDSGGPVYIKLADGTWRVFGITSYGGQCGSGGVYSIMHNGMTWFEEQSGIDITPCHTADGQWDPTIDCQGFPSEPGLGGGSWPDGCVGGASGGLSTTCGAPWDMTPDTTPPTLTISEPVDGQKYVGDGGAQVKVVVKAEDVGWGMDEVRLLVDGEEIQGGVDAASPFEFTLFFPTGSYCLGASGTDRAGNVGEAAQVCVGVNEEPSTPAEETTGAPEPTTEASPTEANPTADGDDTGAPVGESGGESSGGATAGEGEGEGGCGCRSGQVPGDSLLALAGLGLLARGRRRRSA